VNITRRSAILKTAKTAAGLTWISYLGVGLGQVPPRGGAKVDDAYIYMATHTLSQRLSPLLKIATCDVLDGQISSLNRELARVKIGNISVGAELRHRFEQDRANLENSLIHSAKALADQDIDLLAAEVSLGLGIVFLAVGAVITSPLAIGALVAAEVVSGPVVFGWQVIKKQSADSTMVVGYARDRALLFGDLLTEKASSTPGKIVKHSITAISMFISLSDAIDAKDTKLQLMENGKMLRDELVRLESFLGQLGTNDAAWANCYRNVLEGAIRNLKMFVESTRGNGCVVQGPAIIRP
jgi:hypothetical protein